MATIFDGTMYSSNATNKHSPTKMVITLESIQITSVCTLSAYVAMSPSTVLQTPPDVPQLAVPHSHNFVLALHLVELFLQLVPINGLCCDTPFS